MFLGNQPNNIHSSHSNSNLRRKRQNESERGYHDDDNGRNTRGSPPYKRQRNEGRDFRRGADRSTRDPSYSREDRNFQSNDNDRGRSRGTSGGNYHDRDSSIGTYDSHRNTRPYGGRGGRYDRNDRGHGDRDGGERRGGRHHGSDGYSGRHARGGGRGRGRGRKNDKSSKRDTYPSHPYKDKVTRLIEMEKQAEQDQFIERTEKYSNDRLAREGLVLFGLDTPRTAGTFCGKTIYDFRISRETFHQFRSGDMIILSEKHPTRDKRVFDGVVLESGNRSIRVVMDFVPKNVQVWRMDKGANTIVYERQADAVKALVHRNPDTAALEDEKFDFKKGDSPLPSGTGLRDLIVESHPSTQHNGSPKPDFVKLAAEKPDIEFDHTKLAMTQSLTPSQKEAILACVQRKLTIIQGPPGTGKTTTICHLVKSLRGMLPKNYPILVSAYTNLAVDQMLQGLLDEGVKALRIGNPIRVNPKYFKATVDSHVEAHSMNREIKNMSDNIQSLRKSLKFKSGRDIGFTHRDISLIRKEMFGKKKQMMDSILEEADVVCCTCVGAASDVLDTKDFGIVILDECSQITEPSALIPIVHGARMVVLVGDSAQLPPVILSHQAAKDGLNMSLLQRMEDLGIPVHMLREQFRMHPTICEFPSQTFYKGLLSSHQSTLQRAMPRGVDWVNPKVPVMFLQTGAQEESSDQSKKNSGQAKIVAHLLEKFIRHQQELEVGVITPYLAQISEIFRHAQMRSLPQVSSKEDDRIEVKSVDGFQGREKDLIILSTVRSNNEQRVGFLDDWRRLNVAITRAKCGLIVIGDERTLRSDTVWNKYLAYLEKNGLVQDAEVVLDGH